MSVAIATTPTYTLTFTEQSLDLTTAVNVYVTFAQGSKIITKTGDDLTVTARSITVSLTQSETLNFRAGDLEIQANWTGANGERSCSEVETTELSKQLLKRVLE